MLHTFEIELPTVAHKGRVLMDGIELKGVRSVKVDGTVGDATRLTLEFVPESVLVRLNEPLVVAEIQSWVEDVQDVSSMGVVEEHEMPKRRSYAKAPVA